MKTYTLTEVIELFKTFDRKYTANINSDYWYKTFIEANSPTEEVEIKEDDLIEDAVNAYYHQTVKELERKDLGDIERKNLEGIKQKCKNYFTSQIHPQPSASLASHSCAIGNSIQQLGKESLEALGFKFESIGHNDFELLGTFVDENGIEVNWYNDNTFGVPYGIEGNVMELNNLTDLVYLRMLLTNKKEAGFLDHLTNDEVNNALLNSDKNAKVSDTTEAESSNAADLINKSIERLKRLPESRLVNTVIEDLSTLLNADHQIKISELREKFFKECITEHGSGYAFKKSPNDIFEWFKPYLKTNQP